jgi:catechol 2,3-dioxygenase-like lactoylglutathione lyase family enzyme
VADRYLLLRPGADEASQTPLLNHLGFLVDSIRDVEAAAAQNGITIDRLVDAENTVAAFVRGPAGITIEYVEHKPSFALA